MKQHYYPINMAHNLLGCACLILACSGCAIDPYVTLEKTEALNHIDFDKGVDYANAARLKYQNALSSLAKEKSSLSNWLIVIGAAGVGMVADGASRGVLGGTALIGGTAYTLGTWNTSQPRENAYFEGMKAMDCIQFAAEPLNVSAESKKRFSADIDTLSNATIDLSKSIGLVDIAANQLQDKNSDFARQALSDVNVARTIVNTANETYVAALQLERGRDNAGLSIVNTVNAVNTQVNKAIQGTIPDLAALPGIIKGLASTSDLFVPGVGLAESISKIAGKSTVAATDIKAHGASTLNDALADMKGKAETLASLVLRVRLEVQSINSAQALAKMRSCGIEVDLEIQVMPTQLTFLEKQAATKNLIISGGKKPYIAYVTDKPSPISANSPFPIGDSKAEVIASGDTKGGDSYTVYVQDAAGKIKAITVSIQATTTSPPAAPTKAEGSSSQLNCPAANSPAFDSSKDSFAQEEISKVQAVVGTSIDGKIGKKTRQKICTFQNSNSLEEKEGWVGQKTYMKLKANEKWGQ